MWKLSLLLCVAIVYGQELKGNENTFWILNKVAPQNKNKEEYQHQSLARPTSQQPQKSFPFRPYSFFRPKHHSFAAHTESSSFRPRNRPDFMMKHIPPLVLMGKTMLNELLGGKFKLTANIVTINAIPVKEDRREFPSKLHLIDQQINNKYPGEPVFLTPPEPVVPLDVINQPKLPVPVSMTEITKQRPVIPHMLSNTDQNSAQAVATQSQMLMPPVKLPEHIQGPTFSENGQTWVPDGNKVNLFYNSEIPTPSYKELSKLYDVMNALHSIQTDKTSNKTEVLGNRSQIRTTPPPLPATLTP